MDCEIEPDETKPPKRQLIIKMKKPKPDKKIIIPVITKIEFRKFILYL